MQTVNEFSHFHQKQRLLLILSEEFVGATPGKNRVSSAAGGDTPEHHESTQFEEETDPMGTVCAANKILF